MTGAVTFARSQGLYPTRWCDIFDVPSSVPDGWMLLDLPGAPCDVTQPQMRTMSQRLRKAQECAAAGGKYGLVQAVLLSLDSQPDCPAHWLRVAIALEACSKVLLPAAHETHVDLGAARAAYQQLTPAEQQLWRQLQAARIQLKHSWNAEPDDTRGYLVDPICAANVLGGVTGDASLVAHHTMLRLMQECRWDLVCRLTKRYGLANSARGPVSMQAAYNWALAAYFHHGKNHSETKAALAATKAADPQAWVPQLMAGLAYPPLAMAPGSIPGSRMEAVGYAWHFGALWAASSDQVLPRMMEMVGDTWATYSTPLKWLMNARNVAVCTPEQQRAMAGLRKLNCGEALKAHTDHRKMVYDAVQMFVANPWPGCRPQIERMGAAKVLRALVIYIMSAAAMTMNLPPFSAGLRLWEGYTELLGDPPVTNTGADLKCLAMQVVPAACDMINWYYGQYASVPAATAVLGFWGPRELGQLLLQGPSLTLAGARWYWQCGDAEWADRECTLDRDASALSNFKRGVQTNRSGRATDKQVNELVGGGLLPPTLAPINGLAQFLRQQKQQQRPEAAGGCKMVVRAHLTTKMHGAAAGAAIYTQAGDPAEQRLYEQFPGWLDQLVSQVTGRALTLVIEPKGAYRLDVDARQLTCRVYLQDATSGQKEVFGWRQVGDADASVTYEGLVQAARRGGCRDPDLLQYCAGVEPYEGPAKAGSSGGSSKPVSSIGPTPVGGQHTPPLQAAAPAPAAPPAAAAAAPQPSSASVAGSVDSGRVKPAKPCAQCGELFPKLKLCTRCRSVSYCSKECQVAHWKAGHKQVCKEQPAE